MEGLSHFLCIMLTLWFGSQIVLMEITFWSINNSVEVLLCIKSILLVWNVVLIFCFHTVQCAKGILLCRIRNWYIIIFVFLVPAQPATHEWRSDKEDLSKMFDTATPNPTGSLSGPWFDVSGSGNVTGVKGRNSHLACRVKNLANQTVNRWSANGLAVVDESYNFDLVTATTTLYFVGIRQWIQLLAITFTSWEFENMILLKVKGWVLEFLGLTDFRIEVWKIYWKLM